MAAAKKVHWFSAPGQAPCGARGALRFSINPSQITCPRCRKGAGQHFGRQRPFGVESRYADRTTREAR